MSQSEIDSVLLIRTVQKYEALYNSNDEGYSNKAQKELIWEDVSRTVVPNFDSFSRYCRENIRTNVKRRWKSLRNLVAKEVKKSSTIENYMRKKESVLLDEMEFLLPHIRSTSLGSRINGYPSFGDSSYTNGQDSNINETTEDDDYEDCIDLTEDVDMKPFMKLENHESDYEVGVYPIAELGADSVHEQSNSLQYSKASTWFPSPPPNLRNDLSTSAEYRNGEFGNSNTNQTVCDSSNDQSRNDSHDDPLMSKKRARVENEDDSTNTTVLQQRIFQLLENIERRDKPEPEPEKRDEANDEDRMFLLSLVSELRRVPSSKKMLVKAEIATVIAKGMTGKE